MTNDERDTSFVRMYQEIPMARSNTSTVFCDPLFGCYTEQK